MIAVTANEIHPADPLVGLRVDDRPEPEERPGWARVAIRAASLNHHDVFTLRGVGIDADRLPIVLGCDGAGVTSDGREVLLHSMITAPDSERLYSSELYDPQASMLSERHDGTFAEYVLVPETKPNR